MNVNRINPVDRERFWQVAKFQTEACQKRRRMKLAHPVVPLIADNPVALSTARLRP
jgi:hypothetical protein